MPAAALRLVLLPGLNGQCALFAPLLAALPAQWQPLPLRLPEHGAQDPASLAAALRPELQALEQPWLLLGESFSGALAHLLCRRLERPPVGLILASSFLQRPRRLMPPAWLPAPLRAGLLQPWLIEQACLGRGASAAQIEAVAEQIRQLPPALLAARLRTLRQLQPPDAALTLPTLQLAACQDRLVSTTASRNVARYCTQLQRVELDGPHFLLQRQPQACAAAIERFAAGLTSRALP